VKNLFLVERHNGKNHDVSAVVLAADIESPLEHISDVEKELTDSNVTGMVVFDLLVSHGNNRNRFFSGYFDGKSFIDRDFKSESNLYSVFSEMSAPILKNHVDALNSILLSKAMKFAIKKGIPM